MKNSRAETGRLVARRSIQVDKGNAQQLALNLGLSNGHVRNWPTMRRLMDASSLRSHSSRVPASSLSAQPFPIRTRLAQRALSTRTLRPRPAAWHVSGGSADYVAITLIRPAAMAAPHQASPFRDPLERRVSAPRRDSAHPPGDPVPPPLTHSEPPAIPALAGATAVHNRVLNRSITDSAELVRNECLSLMELC